jgi:hypothetical protein
VIAYKLTDSKYQTHNNTQWGVNITHEVNVKKTKPELCSTDVIHYYTTPTLALLLNPAHANIDNPIIWECEADQEVAADYGKSGCFQLTTKRIIKTNITDTHMHRIRIRFAILCAESVLKIFNDKYPNDDRPKKAIEAAKEYISGGITAYAAYAAAYAAANTAYAAANTAYAAANTAAYAAANTAADAAYAANTAADAAYAAAYAAANTAYAAANTAYAQKPDFNLLANQAFKEEFNNEKAL